MTMSIPQSYKAQLFEGLKDKVIKTDFFIKGGQGLQEYKTIHCAEMPISTLDSPGMMNWRTRNEETECLEVNKQI